MGSSTTRNLCLREGVWFTWSRSSDIFGPVMSVKLTDRPIPDEDYWFKRHFVQEDNAHQVSRSLQHWQIGRSKSEWRPDFFKICNQERFLLNVPKNQSCQVLNNHGDLMAESLFKAEIAGVGDEALEIRVGQQVLGR